MRKILFFIIAAVLFCSCGGNGGKRTPKDEKTKVEEPQEFSTPLSKPIVNVYIENSASMDGFVENGPTEFQQAVYNYLSDIKISKINDQRMVDTLNLNYINKIIIPQGTVSESMDVLEDFIAKLNPTTFKNKGGKRGDTDIAEVIKNVLQLTDEKCVSILVTDGIISPGSGKNAQQYLVNQQIGIKTAFADFLEKEKNAAVIVYQLSSLFTSVPNKIFFYDKENKRILYTGQLSYYVWIIGSKEHLVNLRKAVPDSKFKGGSGVQNCFSIFKGNQKVNYVLHPSIGKYQKSRTNPQKAIEKLEKDRNGKVKFAVNVDFSSLLLDNNYLLDIDNYDNNSKYDLEIKQSDSKAYTHTLIFSSDKITKGPVVVKLKAKRPNWVDDVNDDDGTRAIPEKTFGIKYQIDGVFDVFTDGNKDIYYTEIKVNIN
jgi:hypothetical protein